MKLKSLLAVALCAAQIAAMAAEYADTVVYGTIRTAEANNPVAKAIAISNGKYVYVGDEAGAAEYIQDGVTKVVDYRGKGMVMPGCTDGHSHYIQKFIGGGVALSPDDDKTNILKKVKAAADAARDAGKTCLLGSGWDFHKIALVPGAGPTLNELDDVTGDVSTMISDSIGHSAYCNSECLRRCKIIDGEGHVLINKIAGGLLELDEKGYPTGYVNERVMGYLTRMGGINPDEIVDKDAAKEAILKTQEFLLSTGYTAALDGWSNSLHPTNFYLAAKTLNLNQQLKIVLPMTYEVEPWQDDATIDSEIQGFIDLAKRCRTKQVLPDYVKVFMDGVVESFTGALAKPYKRPEGPFLYESFWSVERLAEITRKCNEKNLTVHTHTMGDAAVKETTDAYIRGGDEKYRNCLVHVRNVRKEDFQRFAEHNIACAAGFTWHALGPEAIGMMKQIMDDEYADHGYPMKSFFDAGVKVSSHSDYPANIPCPQDPFGIMQVAITGMTPDPAKGDRPFEASELVTLEQVFQALTLNGAWQFGLEDERGSIKVGKFADFVFANQDVFTCTATDIGKTKVVSTWFEGEKVYEAPAGSEANPWKVGAEDHEPDVTAWTNGVDTLVVRGAGALCEELPWAESEDGITRLVKSEGVKDVERLVKSLPDLVTVNGLTLEDFSAAALGFVKAAGFSAIAVKGGEAELDVVIGRSDALGESAEWTPVSTNTVEVPAPGEQGFFIVAPTVPSNRSGRPDTADVQHD